MKNNTLKQQENEVLALIIARGGSKSIPRKNILPLAGHPLIAYSIAAGLKSHMVSRVVVSTEDDEIAEISRRYGAQVPFIRPQHLAQDNTPDLPVFQHALHWLEDNEKYHPKIVVQLRPTSPFRRVQHIDEAVYRLLERPDADSIRTVCVPFQNPFKMWSIDGEGIMKPLIPCLKTIMDEIIPAKQNIYNEDNIHNLNELYNMPRQLLPDVYWQTGYVDAAWVDTITVKASMTGERILPLVIDPKDWIDIDSMDDWRRAERLLENQELTINDLGFTLE